MAPYDDNAATDGHYTDLRCTCPAVGRYTLLIAVRGLLSNNNVDVMGIVIIILYAVLSDKFTKRGATTRSYILRYTHYRVIVVHIMYTIYYSVQRYCTAARAQCAWNFYCHRLNDDNISSSMRGDPFNII